MRFILQKKEAFTHLRQGLDNSDVGVEGDGDSENVGPKLIDTIVNMYTKTEKKLTPIVITPISSQTHLIPGGMCGEKTLFFTHLVNFGHKGGSNMIPFN